MKLAHEALDSLTLEVAAVKDVERWLDLWVPLSRIKSVALPSPRIVALFFTILLFCRHCFSNLGKTPAAVSHVFSWSCFLTLWWWYLSISYFSHQFEPLVLFSSSGSSVLSLSFFPLSLQLFSLLKLNTSRQFPSSSYSSIWLSAHVNYVSLFTSSSFLWPAFLRSVLVFSRSNCPCSDVKLINTHFYIYRSNFSTISMRQRRAHHDQIRTALAGHTFLDHLVQVQSLSSLITQDYIRKVSWTR